MSHLENMKKSVNYKPEFKSLQIEENKYMISYCKETNNILVSFTNDNTIYCCHLGNPDSAMYLASQVINFIGDGRRSEPLF